MLKSPHDQAWGYTLFLGELTNGTFAIGSRRHKLRPEGAGNKKYFGQRRNGAVALVRVEQEWIPVKREHCIFFSNRRPTGRPLSRCLRPRRSFAFRR